MVPNDVVKLIGPRVSITLSYITEIYQLTVQLSKLMSSNNDAISAEGGSV